LSLLRLPAALILVWVMMLGAYVLPQRLGGGLATVSAESLARCAEQASGEEAGTRLTSPAEHPREEGCPLDTSNLSEEDPEGDDFFFSELESSTVSGRSGLPPLMLLVHDSHITDLSRRPPRSSIA
jgi:hypothetical protein